ncbi:hypothetical protein IQ249_05115 [Lusitaniella coriacea LEGE 07157]|uniref:Uncharacterized protein n=1 Tax=Lusitaniella coriacea LEGE 07157 TaxID=945747 RepID=A0A8J7B3R6_9CYAN|nr:hypothetical protein [Lusitaniella coriacea]MBE9115277.1 hypothetical protein [Lusitaniella coriacea LEGE 07157]
MSEYQYYEFQAIDRALTTKEQAAIKKLSSRVQLSPTQAIFLYNYGDFRGESEQVLTQYFDVMLYIANWGTWQLTFRFPKALVDLDWFEPYQLRDTIIITQTSQYIVLDLKINEEEGTQGWVEGEGWLPRLLPLRDDLLQGDVRLLYLVWLRTAACLSQYVLEDDPIEPPLPPNLNQLSPQLKTFVEWVELDSDLVAAAAQASPFRQSTTAPPLENWLSALSETERQEFLLKLVRREPHVDLQLISRLKELAGQTRSIAPLCSGKRRLSELHAIAETVKKQRKKQEREIARKKRIRELEDLAPKEAQTWTRVEELIALKRAKSYDEATALLQDLHDLAKYQEQLPEFVRRFEKLKSDYRRSTALMQRFKTIKW